MILNKNITNEFVDAPIYNPIRKKLKQLINTKLNKK